MNAADSNQLAYNGQQIESNRNNSENERRQYPGAGPPKIAGYGLSLADAAVVLLLAGLSLVFFWQIALTNRILAGLDVFAYFYPYRDFVSAAARVGQIPLWNPYLFMGAPLLANSQAAVLYPLHWPLIWLSTPKQIAWSIVIHIWLAGTGAYIFSRLALRLNLLPSLVSAIVFSLGGFLGAQVEHVNQLNASAWFPWLLLCLHGARGQAWRRWLSILAGGGIVGLMLLAGHTQAAYIVVFGTASYAIAWGLVRPSGQRWRNSLAGLAVLAAMVLIGSLLAAGQLLPTLELSRHSVRSGGLPYNEAASFSLKPTLLFKAFLPPFLWDAPFSEYVAYIGIVGLALAGLGTWAVTRQRWPGKEQVDALAHGRTALILALLGVFLAIGAYNPIYFLLYKAVPGFALFRAPARWLLLYSLGAALLAGIGLQGLPRVRAWQAKAVITTLLVFELFLAGQRLAYNKPTAPAAYDSMRTAPAHLLADGTDDLFRFLSMSDLRYDPGDLQDLREMYQPQLSEKALNDLIVATKMKEVLAFNLPLRYRLFSVDGYDGGLLPVRQYVTLEQLFLEQEDIWPDGRLRQQLGEVPPSRLLSLLGVKHIITDKTQDVWVDDIFYDLEHTATLGRLTQTDVPHFETSHLGVASYLTGTAELTDGTPVARVTITSTTGSIITATLRAGQDTAEGLYSPERVAHKQARVGHNWRDNEQGSDYITLLDLEQSLYPESISVSSLLPEGKIKLRGLTLFNATTGTSRNLSVDTAYRLAHSGDVKIYENLDVLPRAFVVHQARVVEDDTAALEILKDPAFDTRTEIVLADGHPLDATPGKSEVSIVDYGPHRVELLVETDAPAYLVLMDTFYPGWTAEVDGRPEPIFRANVYFRAVSLKPGETQVVFQYQPLSVRLGLGVSLLAWLGWAACLAIALGHIGRKSPSEV